MSMGKMHFLKRSIIYASILMTLSGCVRYASVEVVVDMGGYKDHIAVLSGLRSLVENGGYQLINDQNGNLADLKSGDKYYSGSDWLKVDEQSNYVYAGFASVQNSAYAVGLRYKQEENKLILTFYDTVNPEGKFTPEGKALAEKGLAQVREYFPPDAIKKVRKIGW